MSPSPCSFVVSALFCSGWIFSLVCFSFGLWGPFWLSFLCESLGELGLRCITNIEEGFDWQNTLQCWASYSKHPLMHSCDCMKSMGKSLESDIEEKMIPDSILGIYWTFSRVRSKMLDSFTPTREESRTLWARSGSCGLPPGLVCQDCPVAAALVKEWTENSCLPA